jgi:hypothetical protein
MTNAEFWASEAEHEGKGRSAGELQSEFFLELAEDEERTRQQMEKDTEGAHHSLVLYWNTLREDADWTDEDPLRDVRLDEEDFFVQYKPRRVIEILHTELSSTFKETEIHIVMRVLFSGGRIKTVSHSSYTFSGDFYEPPWGEDNVEVLPDDWKPGDEAEA